LQTAEPVRSVKGCSRPVPRPLHTPEASGVEIARRLTGGIPY